MKNGIVPLYSRPPSMQSPSLRQIAKVIIRHLMNSTQTTIKYLMESSIHLLWVQVEIAETFALAIDQLRLLRNSLCHSDKSEIDKPTFDQYVQLAKEAFKALGIKTDPIDAIGGLTESDFPIKEVRKLEESLRQETRSYIECLEEVRAGVDKLIAQGNAIKEKVEELSLLKGEIDHLKRKMDQDQTGINWLKTLQDFKINNNFKM